ncbi:hypothetical protein AAGS61_01630 [Lysinibacillus sp. KU-BSD001]|uniref:hypothetical protein n=1 Tax=Lysinibacillus sp. KU-BSD001 TaxID=3141328 RepID=UPI0036E2D6A7
MIPAFANLSDLASRFDPNKIPCEIKFESFIYRSKEVIREGAHSIIKYRCEKERHNIKVYYVDGIVFKVDADYAIEEVPVH